MLHVYQGKGKKDRYVPLSPILIRGLRAYIESECPGEYLFNGKSDGRAGGDFDGRYSQRVVRMLPTCWKMVWILYPQRVAGA